MAHSFQEEKGMIPVPVPHQKQGMIPVQNAKGTRNRSLDLVPIRTQLWY